MDPTAAKDYSLWFKFTSDSKYEYAEILLQVPPGGLGGEYVAYSYGFPLLPEERIQIRTFGFQNPPDSEHVGFGSIFPVDSLVVQAICGTIEFDSSVTTPQDSIDFLIKRLIARNKLTILALHAFWYFSQGPQHAQTVLAYQTAREAMNGAGVYRVWTGQEWEPTPMYSMFNESKRLWDIVGMDATDRSWKVIHCRCDEGGECWKPEGETQNRMFELQHKWR